MADYFSASVATSSTPGTAVLVIDVADVDRMVLVNGKSGEFSVGFSSSTAVFNAGTYAPSPGIRALSFILPAGMQLWGTSSVGDTDHIQVLVTKSPSSLSLGFCS